MLSLLADDRAAKVVAAQASNAIGVETTGHGMTNSMPWPQVNRNTILRRGSRLQEKNLPTTATNGSLGVASPRIGWRPMPPLVATGVRARNASFDSFAFDIFEIVARGVQRAVIGRAANRLAESTAGLLSADISDSAFGISDTTLANSLAYGRDASIRHSFRFRGSG
jgi:hypothetical protein